MIKCDGIIFDVDGTLWDSTYVVKDAWNKAIVDAGYEDPQITADTLKGLFGLPMDDIIKAIMPELTLDERNAIAPIVFEYEHEFLEKRVGELYPKIIQVMRRLAEEMPVYIISNCQAGYVELFMRKTGIEDIIKAHYCPADTGLLKAGNIKKMINEYNIKYPIYVGDTSMDHKACLEAGCPFMYAEYGFGETEEPDYVVKSPADILKVLGL